jgi:hypothetical protein
VSVYIQLTFNQFAWYAAARALMRFWEVAMQANLPDQALTFWTEVEYIQTALRKAGRRVPLARMSLFPQSAPVS